MISRLRPILIITLIVIAVDQGTKYAAWLFLHGTRGFSYLDGMIRLSYHENPGALLSLGATLPPIWRTLIFTVLVAIFLVYFFYYLLTELSLSAVGVRFGALMFAGGLGNLIDRIFFENGVIDFLNIGIGNLRTGIFNVADMAILIGIIGMLVFGRESGPSSELNTNIEDHEEAPKQYYEFEKSEN